MVNSISSIKHQNRTVSLISTFLWILLITLAAFPSLQFRLIASYITWFALILLAVGIMMRCGASLYYQAHKLYHKRTVGTPFYPFYPNPVVIRVDFIKEHTASLLLAGCLLGIFGYSLGWLCDFYQEPSYPFPAVLSLLPVAKWVFYEFIIWGFRWAIPVTILQFAILFMVMTAQDVYRAFTARNSTSLQ